MPRALKIALLVALLGLAICGQASASSGSSKLLYVQPGTAEAEVLSLSEVPLHFHSSARQAISVAESSPTLRALHRRMHPLRVYAYVWRAAHPYWYIVFGYHGKTVADANVSPDGKLQGVWTGLQAYAPYTHGHLDWSISSWLVLLPASLLFMLPFLDPRRLRRMAHLDGLAVLALLVSYLVLAAGHLEPAVWLVYPPLIYLLFRMLRLGRAADSGGAGRLAPLLSTRVLLIGLPLLLGARLALSFAGHQEIDVGYESVTGAYRILHHLPIYWNDPNHGDTYGPITYLAYVPFQLLFPWSGVQSNLHAADAAAIFFDLGTMLGLVLLGRQLRPRAEGTRLGLVLAWAWAACPFTIINLVVHTNDGLVSMLMVFALLAVRSRAVSGAVLGLAVAAKFSPAALVPLLAAPRKRGIKGAVLFTGTVLAVVVVAIVAWLPPGGLAYFWKRTLGFQLTRLDVFSPWALHPGLHPVQLLIEVLAIVLILAVAFFPRERSLAQLCALAGALTIAVQLPAQHWFYYYIAWFLPFVLVAVLARPVRAGAPVAAVTDLAEPTPAPEVPPRSAALAGV